MCVTCVVEGRNWPPPRPSDLGGPLGLPGRFAQGSDRIVEVDRDEMEATKIGESIIGGGLGWSFYLIDRARWRYVCDDMVGPAGERGIGWHPPSPAHHTNYTHLYLPYLPPVSYLIEI